MFNITRTIIDGLILSGITSVFIIVSLMINPRIWLQDYPEDIQSKVPPKSDSEKRLSLIIGIPFLIILCVGSFFSTLVLKFRNPEASFLDLSLNAFGIVLIFNVVDWLLLDWLMFCTLTPRFVVIPGSEGMAGYKDYLFHFRGFLKGTVFCVISGLVIGGVVSLL